jgi:hypothetical protein
MMMVAGGLAVAAPALSACATLCNALESSATPACGARAATRSALNFSAQCASKAG